MRLCALSLVFSVAFTPVAFPAEDTSTANRKDLTRIREDLATILEKNILPFWYPNVVDRENGGYRLNHDVQGKWLGPATKALVTQARTVWFFARLSRSPFGKTEHLDAARHGYVFLRDRMWDKSHGGFFNEVDPTGTSATMPQKHLYGQSFGLYALSEYARVANDTEAARLARELFAILEFRAHDDEFGGYREFYQRDWTLPPPDAVSMMGLGPDLKLYNTHLHLLEAFTTYYNLTHEPLARERLIELITINSNSVVRKTVGGCTDQHRLDWTPLHGPEFDRISYGHDLENTWLLMEACEAAGIADQPLADLYRTFFDYSLKYGFDRENGGFYYWGPFHQPAANRDKSWWVQAEALVSSLRMYARTGEAKYLDCFRKTLEWVEKRHVDWKGGDWFHLVKEDGSIEGGKAGAWKSPYHNGRAMLECIEILDSLLAE